MYLTTFFSFVLLSVLLVKWILKRKRIFSTFERLGIPGPKPSFFTGNLSSLAKPYGEVDLIEKYGPIYGFFLGAVPMIGVADPELLKIIQVKEAQIFHARNPVITGASVPHHTLDKSVPFARGQYWKESRDSMTPGYTTSKFKMMNSLLNNELDEVVAEISSFAEEKQSFDMGRIHSFLFARVFLQISLGIKIKEKKGEAVQKLFESLERTIIATFSNIEILLSVCFPEVEPFISSFRRFREHLRHAFDYRSVGNIVEICDKVIKTRKNETSEKTDNYTDLIQHMLKAIKKKQSASVLKSTDDSTFAENYIIKDEDILFNSLYTATTMFGLIKYSSTYAAYELAKLPNVQEKLRKEILEVNGDRKHISYESLSKMKYLDNVFNESLRLHPTAPFFTNRIAEEDYYYKGQLIPKGMTVHVPQLGLNRSALNFHDPEAFIPERFDEKVDPYIYQPFGNGPRHCFGLRISRYFGKLTLARMVQSFNLTVDPKAKKVEPDFRFIVHCPKDTVQLLASPA